MGVVIPFFTATNVARETAIPVEALGCPLRLQREKDGTPRFGKTGRPAVRVIKDIADQVRIMRENFVSGLLNYADSVKKGMPEDYKLQVEACIAAGIPIAESDATCLSDYLAKKAEEAAASVAQLQPMDTRERVPVG